MNLPEPVIAAIREASVANYVTLTRDLRPIDTPVLCFPGEGFKSIDLATGLAYPAKAERARRNAKVGMLIEAAEGGPVVAIAGIAAVRDADLQANVNRYLTEAAQVLPHNPDWSLARQAVWYWTRILIEVTPADVLWWDSARAMDGAPHRWSAGDAAVYPASDPAPPGRVSEAASWQPSDWRALADAALMGGAPGHVSVVDAAGWPRVAPVRAAGRSDAGFVLEVAAGLPADVVARSEAMGVRSSWAAWRMKSRSRWRIAATLASSESKLPASPCSITALTACVRQKLKLLW